MTQFLCPLNSKSRTKMEGKRPGSEGEVLMAGRSPPYPAEPEDGKDLFLGGELEPLKGLGRKHMESGPTERLRYTGLLSLLPRPGSGFSGSFLL